MNAGYHECRKCKDLNQRCEGCRRTNGNVPIRPLGEAILAIALGKFVALSKAFDQLAAYHNLTDHRQEN